jgi:hypothetical protein
LHAVNLSGTGNAVRNSRFVSAGSETDETCVIAIGSTATDAVVAGNAFGGTRGYAMILGNAAAEKLVSITGNSRGRFSARSLKIHSQDCRLLRQRGRLD